MNSIKLVSAYHGVWNNLDFSKLMISSGILKQMKNYTLRSKRFLYFEINDGTHCFFSKKFNCSQNKEIKE